MRPSTAMSNPSALRLAASLLASGLAFTTRSANADTSSDIASAMAGPTTPRSRSVTIA